MTRSDPAHSHFLAPEAHHRIGDPVDARFGAYDPLANFHGGAGDDTYAGGNSADSISGGGGDDTLAGGAGNDTIDGGTGNDVLDGGVGIDTLSYASAKAGVVVDLTISADQATGGGGVDRLTGFENILGSVYNDRLTGTADANTIEGGAGDDTLVGGGGIDTASYADASAGVNVRLGSAGAQDTSGAGIDTLSGFTNLIGSAFADTLAGTSGDNTLDGGAGVDIVSYAGSATGVTVSLALQGAAQITNAGADLLRGFEGLVGTNQNDQLTGDDSDNTINGLLGDDTLTGGLGNDTYVIQADSHATIIEHSGGGSDTVISSIDIKLADNVENLILVDTANHGTGNTGNNNIVGNDLGDSLTGGGGNDTLSGGAGSDTLDGYPGNDLLMGYGGNDTLESDGVGDTLIGGIGNDRYDIRGAAVTIVENAGEGIDTVYANSINYTLPDNVENLVSTGRAATGNELDNTISVSDYNCAAYGLAGDDSLTATTYYEETGVTLDGGAGADTMVGGGSGSSSHDSISFYVDNTSDVVEAGSQFAAADIIYSSVSYTMSANVGKMVLLEGGDIDATGNAGANKITGNNENNVLDGGAGADTLTGGYGNDTYIVDGAGDVVTEGTNAGVDIVVSSISYVLGANVENLQLTGSGPSTGTGNALDNQISGSDGNNTLDGGAGGIDTLSGGLGDDTYIVDSTSDQIIEAVGAGTDTVRSSASYLLGANIENLVLTGSSPLRGVGNELANAITANDAGSTLVGNGGDDTLNGGAGDDSLVGGTGFDSMSGGAGDDVSVVDSANDVVVELANGGVDTIISSVSYTLEDNVEILRFSGSGDLDGVGNASDNNMYGTAGVNHLSGLGGDDSLHSGLGADVLDGGAGADTLSGGMGADTMIGGAGADTFVVDDAGDVVVEQAGGGTDKVESAVSYTLTANVENLVLTGSGAIDGAGNALDNNIKGNAKANVLDGGGGDDILNGGGGRDTASYQDASGGVSVNLFLTAAQDTGSAGTDTLVKIENLTGSAFDDALHGDIKANVLSGGGGDDTLRGAQGADTLTGGAGSDDFSYQAVLNSTRKAPDLITDLTNQDTIDLSLIDADTTQAGSQHFHIVSAFSHHAGELTITYDAAHDVTRFQGDVDGDNKADLVILASGDHTGFSGLVV